MNKLILNDSAYDYKTYGDPGLPSLLIMPSWYLFNNNQWLFQIEYLKNFYHLVVFSPADAQNRSRIEEEAIHQPESIGEKAIHLLDHLKIDKVYLLGFYMSCAYALYLANKIPDRVSKIILINNPYDLTDETVPEINYKMLFQRYDGWKKWAIEHPDTDDHIKGRFFYEKVLNEFKLSPVSKGIIGCSKIINISFLEGATSEPFQLPQINAYALAENIACPVCLIHGELDDSIISESYKAICELKQNFKYAIIENTAHMPHFFSPVKVNLLLDSFLKDRISNKNLTKRKAEKKIYNALYIPSPIGLGHVQRDLALVRELRKQADISVEWLIPQGPARYVLETAGEKVTPYSDELQSVLSTMVESSKNHEMNFFEKWRKSEGIRVANFMTFLKAVDDNKYDLWIGDEAWEVDHYLHVNPKMKTAPFIFLTDFIGWLPIDKSQNSSEALIARKYNFEMMKLVEENPKVRDKAFYIGHYFDIIDERFGYQLPYISDWARDYFSEAGYLYSFNPKDNDIELYRELGLEYGQKFIIVSVGGTIVGESLVKKAIRAWPHVYRQKPDLHCVIVLGPSINLDTSDIKIPNLIIKRYIKDLHRYFAITELGIVQGGLGTTMELAIHKQPFLYFPLKDHCEQMYHVDSRLKKYKSGKRLDWDTTDEFSLAEHILDNLNRDTSCYYDHNIDNVKKTASLILDVI